MKRLALTFSLLACGCASESGPAARASMAPSPSEHTPAAEGADPMKALAFYIGDWSCDVEDLEASTRSTATAQVRPVLDGRWVTVQMRFPPTPENPRGSGSFELRGYDAEAKRWVHLWSTSSAQAGVSTSPGWEGDRSIWTPTEQPSGARERYVFTRLNDTHYSYAIEADSGAGFKKVWVKTCEKKPGSGPGVGGPAGQGASR